MQFLLYSGGLDSFILLHHLRRGSPPEDICALTFDYGQRADIEMAYAAQECARLGVRQIVLPLSTYRLMDNPLLKQGSAMPSDPGPAGIRAASEIPGRNVIFLSIALSIAYDHALRSLQDAWVFNGINWDPDQENAPTHPDCLPGFIASMSDVYHEASAGRVKMVTPLAGMTKKDVLTFAKATGLVSADFARAYSCYEGAPEPCGRCRACLKREAAFASMGWHDPASPTE